MKRKYITIHTTPDTVFNRALKTVFNSIMYLHNTQRVPSDPIKVPSIKAEILERGESLEMVSRVFSLLARASNSPVMAVKSGRKIAGFVVVSPTMPQSLVCPRKSEPSKNIKVIEEPTGGEQLPLIWEAPEPVKAEPVTDPCPEFEDLMHKVRKLVGPNANIVISFET